MEAIYARQSVDKKDSLSIEGQIQLCERAAGEPCQVYQDKGYSGKNTHRPDFERMMSDVAKGNITKIYVYRLDRFSRSIADFGQLWSTLERHGVQFESITEKFDTSTPMGRAMLNIIMVFAQLERETTAERVRDNYYHRLQLGAWPGGPAPLGFDMGRLQGEDGHRTPTLIPNEQAEVAREIFQLYSLAGASLGSVARTLNARGVSGIKRKTWDNVSISRILHNPVYVMADENVYWFFQAQGVPCAQRPEDFRGAYACNLVGKRNRSGGGYQEASKQMLALANHFGLVPADLWLRCQEKLSRNRQISRESVGKHSWLSGLLKCGCCGYAVKINQCDGKYYLLCSGRSNLKLCENKIQVDLRELEGAVETEITAHLARCPQEDSPPQTEAAYELTQIDVRIQRLVEAVASGSAVTASYLNQEIERLHRERERLLKEKTSHPGRDAGQLTKLVFPKLSFEEKKLVARRLIQKISLRGDTVHIDWAF